MSFSAVLSHMICFPSAFPSLAPVLEQRRNNSERNVYTEAEWDSDTVLQGHRKAGVTSIPVSCMVSNTSRMAANTVSRTSVQMSGSSSCLTFFFALMCISTWFAASSRLANSDCTEIPRCGPGNQEIHLLTYTTSSHTWIEGMRLCY